MASSTSSTMSTVGSRRISWEALFQAKFPWKGLKFNCLLHNKMCAFLNCFNANANCSLNFYRKNLQIIYIENMRLSLAPRQTNELRARKIVQFFKNIVSSEPDLQSRSWTYLTVRSVVGLLSNVYSIKHVEDQINYSNSKKVSLPQKKLQAVSPGTL